MANADEAIKYTLVNEGGYSNVPQDAGGPTNFGITQAEYSNFKGYPQSADDIKHMPLSDAIAIYKSKYWIPAFEELDQAVATAIFDWGVLHGPFSARELAQVVANKCGASLSVDGVIGPLSIAALNNINSKYFVYTYAQSMIDWFNQRVASHPNQSVFLQGWTNRANRLKSLV